LRCQAILTARAHSKSWAEIATMLGVTRQSAWEKWHDLDAVPAEVPETVPAGESEVGGDVVGGDVVGEVVDRALSGLAEPHVVTVPDLIGLPWADARQALADARFLPVAPENHGPLPQPDESAWVVVDQTPTGGARRSPGSSVTVWLDRGGGTGVREPRRPTPTLRSARGERDEESQEAVG
jgi:hypothetical protein